MRGRRSQDTPPERVRLWTRSRPQRNAGAGPVSRNCTRSARCDLGNLLVPDALCVGTLQPMRAARVRPELGRTRAGRRGGQRRHYHRTRSRRGYRVTGDGSAVRDVPGRVVPLQGESLRGLDRERLADPVEHVTRPQEADAALGAVEVRGAGPWGRRGRHAQTSGRACLARAAGLARAVAVLAVDEAIAVLVEATRTERLGRGAGAVGVAVRAHFACATDKSDAVDEEFG